ncbi:MAG: periplasmic heavy metal sensor [Pseudomonadota bacterium]
MSDGSVLPFWRRAPRWVWMLLIVSLAANFAVAGVYAGRAMRSEPVDPELGRYYSRVVALLPEERREAARSVILARSDLAEDRASFGGRLMQATETVTAAMTAEPFDPEALSDALSVRMDVFRSRFTGRQDRLIALAETLTPRERAMIAEEMRRRTKRRIARWTGR